MISSNRMNLQGLTCVVIGLSLTINSCVKINLDSNGTKPCGPLITNYQKLSDSSKMFIPYSGLVPIHFMVTMGKTTLPVEFKPKANIGYFSTLSPYLRSECADILMKEYFGYTYSSPQLPNDTFNIRGIAGCYQCVDSYIEIYFGTTSFSFNPTLLRPDVYIEYPQKVVQGKSYEKVFEISGDTSYTSCLFTAKEGVIRARLENGAVWERID